MQIDLNGEAERIILEQVSSGRFATAEDAANEALRLLSLHERGTPLTPFEELQRKATEQGVAPLKDGTELNSDFWPEDEPIEEFLAFLGELRRQTDLRMQRLMEIWD
jgi:hypothetical protein